MIFKSRKLDSSVKNKSLLSTVKVKLATVVEGGLRAPFLIATTPRCRRRRYSFPWVAQLYP